MLWSLAVRAIKVRCKQTALGVIWVALQSPFFALVFGVLAGLPSDGRPYFLFALAEIEKFLDGPVRRHPLGTYGIL